MNTRFLKVGDCEVLYAKTADVQGIAVKVIFNAGAINDPSDKLGVAHFCEHILAGFPTQNMTKDERFEKANEFQYFNACTRAETVSFEIMTIAEHFYEAIDYLTQPFESVVLNEEELEKERKVIIDEIATTPKYNSSVVLDILNEKCMKDKHYHHLKNCYAGTNESITKITIDDITQYIEKYFTLNNMTFVVVGNISKKEVVNAVKKYLLTRIKKSNIQGFLSRNLKEDIFRAPKYYYGKSIEKDKAIVDFSYHLGMEKFSRSMRDIDYIKTILSQMLHSLFMQSMRIEKGLCYFCSSSIYSQRKGFQHEDYIECKDENLDEIVDAYAQYIRSLPSQLDKNNFEICKKNIFETLDFDYRTLRNLADDIESFYYFYGTLLGVKLKKYRRKKIISTSYEEVNAVYQNYIKLNQRLLLFLTMNNLRIKTFQKVFTKKLP